jgi:hypothetical protein
MVWRADDASWFGVLTMPASWFGVLTMLMVWRADDAHGLAC